MTFQTCVYFFLLWNTKYILKNVGNQTTLEPIDLHCMAKKTDISQNIFFLEQHKHEIMHVSQATPPPPHTHTHTFFVKKKKGKICFAKTHFMNFALRFRLPEVIHYYS